MVTVKLNKMSLLHRTGKYIQIIRIKELSKRLQSFLKP